MFAALHFSPTGAWVLIAGGVTACLIAVFALRLMAIYWGQQVALAATRRVMHVVRPRIDFYGQVLWCVVYTLGGLAMLWGLWALGT